MATTERKSYDNQRAELSALTTQIEAAALNAQNLLYVANRELLEDLERGLSLVAAAERFVSDVIAISEKLCTATAAKPAQH